MLKAVLLDLDNTLILFDEPAFYKRYFARLCGAFADVFPPDELTSRVLRATMALQHNDGTKNNGAFFMDALVGEHTSLKDPLWQRFLAFYETEYEKIDVDVRVPDGLHDVLALLRESGLKQVLASNPIYPEITFQKRLAWASLDPSPFDLITHMENMSFVKPRTEYYLQICETIDEAPENCLMVGNDPVNDTVAGAAGLKTFQTTEAGEINYASVTLPEDPSGLPRHVPTPDFSGPFAGVTDIVRQLCT